MLVNCWMVFCFVSVYSFLGLCVFVIFSVMLIKILKNMFCGKCVCVLVCVF